MRSFKLYIVCGSLFIYLFIYMMSHIIAISHTFVDLYLSQLAALFRTLMSFFKTLDTKLKTVITCNTGCLMFKTLHCAFTSLKKSCTCTIIGSKDKFTVRYHWNITIDHPHTRHSFEMKCVNCLLKWSYFGVQLCHIEQVIYVEWTNNLSCMSIVS